MAVNLSWLSLVFRRLVEPGANTKNTTLTIEDLDGNFKIIKDNINTVNGKQIIDMPDFDGVNFLDGQTFKWNSATQKFIPTDFPAAGTGGGGYIEVNATDASYTVRTQDNNSKITFTGGNALIFPAELDSTAIGLLWFENRIGGALVKLQGTENFTFKNSLGQIVNINQLEIGKQAGIEGAKDEVDTFYIKGDWTHVEEITLNNTAIVDFGGTNAPSAAPILNVHSAAGGQNLQLPDTSGTGNLNWYLQILSGTNMQTANVEGYAGAVDEFPISACIDYLFYNNPNWTQEADVTTRTIRLIVDDIAATYTIRLFSSRNQSGERRGRFTIGGVTKTINAVGNITVEPWTAVAPNAQGEIDIVMRPEVFNGILYLNCLSIAKE